MAGGESVSATSIQASPGAHISMDVVVGSYGGLSKLFHERYLKKGRVAHIVLDEVSYLLPPAPPASPAPPTSYDLPPASHLLLSGGHHVR